MGFNKNLGTTVLVYKGFLDTLFLTHSHMLHETFIKYNTRPMFNYGNGSKPLLYWTSSQNIFQKEPCSHVGGTRLLLPQKNLVSGFLYFQTILQQIGKATKTSLPQQPKRIFSCFLRLLWEAKDHENQRLISVLRPPNNPWSWPKSYAKWFRTRAFSLHFWMDFW